MTTRSAADAHRAHAAVARAATTPYLYAGAFRRCVRTATLMSTGSATRTAPRKRCDRLGGTARRRASAWYGGDTSSQRASGPSRFAKGPYCPTAALRPSSAAAPSSETSSGPRSTRRPRAGVPTPSSATTTVQLGYSLTQRPARKSSRSAGTSPARPLEGGGRGMLRLPRHKVPSQYGEMLNRSGRIRRGATTAQARLLPGGGRARAAHVADAARVRRRRRGAGDGRLAEVTCEGGCCARRPGVDAHRDEDAQRLGGG